MRLLFVHQSFGSLGGAEANILATAGALRQRGYGVGLLSREKTGRGEAAWRELFGDELFILGETGAQEAVSRFRPDALYVHKWEELPSLEQLLASGLPAVHMVHDHDLYCLRSYRYHPLTRRICHRAMGACCIFPCLAPLKRNPRGPLPFRWASYFEKKRELALGRRFNVSLVATQYMRNELLLNGFSSERIEICAPVPPAADPVRSSFSERNLLVFAGQLVRGKGVDVLLRALAQVRGKFEVLILGEGNHRSKCEALSAKLGLADRVTFKGFVPQNEIRALYAEATAVLVSSVWPEPMGLVGIEAMRFALPVVAFDAGGIKEWLRDGENGFLVPWMDTAAYARRVEELLSDKAKAREMGGRGLERAGRDFAFDRYIDRLETIFAWVAAYPPEALAA
jgi:glycosyltransferase involved in cell wall biosynthesis